ncbi:MAG: gliding motility-associated C-terminal domain-containing protein, partial [Fulvivirga sp.]
PAPTANAGSDEEVCAGDALDLSTSATVPTATNASSLLWTSSGDGSFDDDTALTPIYTPGAADITAGTVTLTLQANGNAPCTPVTDDMILTITAPPTANAGSDETVCEGSSFDLSTSATAPTATNASSLLWTTSGDGGFDDDTALTPIYTPGAADITAGTVTLTLQANGNGSCAAVTDDMVLTVEPAPTANAGSDEEVCAGDALDLSTSATVPTATNASSLLWTSSGDGSFDDDTALTPIYTPGAADITAGTVTLTLQANGNAPCAPVTDDMILTITAPPTANAGSDETVCEGSSFDLSTSATAPTATNASSLLWTSSGDGSFDDDTALTPVYTPGAADITAGTVTLTLQANGNGSCAAVTDDMVLTINPLPTPTISGVTTVCLGDSEFYNTEAGQSNYNWTVTGGTIVVGGAGNTIAVDWDGAGPTYEVSVNYTDGNGCTAASPTTQAITVVNSNLTLSQSPDPGLCPGNSVELTASTGFDTYEFRDGVGGPVLQAASADNTFDATTFTDGQEIEVEAVSGVCGTVTETIIVNVNAAPSVTLTQSPDPGCSGSSVELTATAGFDTYEFRDGVGGPVLQAASADNTFDATTFTNGQEIEVEAVSGVCGTLTTTIFVNIVTPPTLILSQDPDPGCDGSPIEITASAGFDTYEFRDGVGGPVLQAASADNTFDATTFANGQIIEVEGTTASCGTFTETITLNVTTVAALALSQSPDPGTCPGTSVEITATAGYDTYEFRDGVGGPVLQAASADNTFDATTFTDGQIIEVEAIVAGCGTFTETITVNVAATPSLILSQAPDPGLCPGASVEITASAGFDTYEFRDGVSGPVLQAASADNTFDATTFADGQIIEVEAFSATCGTVLETITMSINAAPSVTITQSPDPGCAGASIELTATTGFDTYEFRDGIGGPVLQAASPDNTFDATTFTNGQEIEVEAVSGACGTLTTTINVNVTTVAALTLSQSPDPGCVGGSVEITASVGFDTYEFRDGVGGPVLQAASADNTFDATTFTDGQEIEVEAVSAVCGTTISTIVLSLDAVPTLTITQNPDPGLCAGSSVELTAIAGYDTYEFRDGVSGPVLQAASADNTFDATTFSNGQVIEVEAISAGCGTFTETISVNVNAAPAVTLTQSPDPVCQGLNLTLTATTGFDTYEFRDGVGGPVLQAASASNTFTNSGLTDGQEIEVVAFSATCGSVTNTFNVNILAPSDPSCGGGGGGPICSSVTSLSISNVVNPDCGLENGSLRIDATFSPAQASVIYGLQYYDEDIADSVFNTQLNNPDFTDLAALNYRYFVTAGVDTCFLNFNLAPKTSVNAGIVAGSLQNVTCFGQPSGSIEVENLSGSSSGDYFYSINGGTWTLLNAARIPNASDPNGLVSGINVIRVGDMVNDPCPERLEVSVANTNPMITFDAQVDQNLTTCDSNDGEISVDFPPAGGANGSGDDWFIAFKRTSIPVTDGDFGLFSEDVTFNNLIAESYTVYIRDISGCTVNEQFDINAPGTIDLSATVSSASCTDVDEGRITLTVDNRSTLNTQFEVTIVDQDNPSDTLFNINDGWTGGTRVFPPITETGLVSGDYIAFVSSEGTGICEADTLFTVSGGPIPVSFDPPMISCGNDGDNKQLVLSNIQGDNSVDYTLRVTEGPTEIMTETFTLSGLDDDYEVTGTAFLNQPADYELELIQSQPQCTDDINSGKMILRVEPNLNASVTILSSSAPDLASGSYRVEVENETGIAPYVVASDFVTQTKHPDYVLNGTESSGPDTLTFNSIEDRFEIIYEGKPTGEYEIMVMDAQGCVQPQPQPFIVEIPLDSTLFIPNIFTPNNDDLNDFFKIRNLKAGSKLLITNRWGNEIFRSDNYSNETAWDGEETPDGVYYYRLESPDGQIYTGWVEILRGSSP